jgi:hypothetical protein
MENRIDRRLTANPLHTGIYRIEELFAQADTARLIPNIGFGNIEFSFRR